MKMGFYLNVPGNASATEHWLRDNGEWLRPREERNYNYDENKENVIVCLIDNIQFTSAAILFNAAEAARFFPWDGRLKEYFKVPIEKLKTVVPEDDLIAYGLISKTQNNN